MHDAIHITPEDSAFAETIHARFAGQPGAEHIASKVALSYLAACLRQFKPRKILELGAGIGTITQALLSHPASVKQVVSTEDNDFCLAALRKNINDSRLVVTTKPADLKFFSSQADMIVGDGGFYSAEEMATAKLGTVFFTEGNRSKLRKMFVNSISPRGWTIDFKEYGATCGEKPITRKFLGISISKAQRVKSRGCWIGIVREANK